MIDSAQKQSLRQNITTIKESLYMIGLHMSNEFFYFFFKVKEWKIYCLARTGSYNQNVIFNSDILELLRQPFFFLSSSFASPVFPAN